MANNTEKSVPTITLTVRECEGKTTFNGKEYYKYKINDSTGHYFTKLSTKEYGVGEGITYMLKSYKGQISLKEVM